LLIVAYSYGHIAFNQSVNHNDRALSIKSQSSWRAKADSEGIAILRL